MEVNAILRFGPEDRLTGVLAGPPGQGPILLLPSAGLQPRAGPFRLHVELAERLRARGIRSFRYDVPGVGEAPRLHGCDAQQATLAAIDRLESTQGCNSFAVGGICSAADTGWEVANMDQRITGVLLLDGVCCTGPWYHCARVLDRLQRFPTEWRRMLGSARERFGNKGPELDANAFRTTPTHAQAREQFAELVARDVRLLCIYSGGYAERFMHPRQFEWTFGPPVHDPRVTMHFWPDCDHTYFGRAHRDRLIGTIEDWMVGLAAGAGS
ncbi:MAG: hypothetical protein M3Q42_13170 [Pseudomonadota bacterium]|nr:hypothetical protein [Pseudomonadota bacterium]